MTIMINAMNGMTGRKILTNTMMMMRRAELGHLRRGTGNVFMNKPLLLYHMIK